MVEGQPLGSRQTTTGLARTLECMWPIESRSTNYCESCSTAILASWRAGLTRISYASPSVERRFLQYLWLRCAAQERKNHMVQLSRPLQHWTAGLLAPQNRLSAESWLNQQTQYYLWHAEQRRKRLRVAKLAGREKSFFPLRACGHKIQT